jgi:hypothetical protein
VEEKKKNIIILCLLVVIFILLIIIFCLSLKKENSINDLIINEVIDESNNPSTDIPTGTTTEDNNVLNSNLNESNIESNTEYNDDVNENSVIQYFDNMNDEINESNFEKCKTKFKDYFITGVDFIFYDKKIKGYTFNELSNEAKLKVIAILIKIDNKIEKYAPGYKESISNTGSRIYTDIKERLITAYFDISTKMCSNNTYECDMAKEIFGDVKNECKIGLSYVKKVAISGGRKIKDWYEIYSGK